MNNPRVTIAGDVGDAFVTLEGDRLVVTVNLPGGRDHGGCSVSAALRMDQALVFGRAYLEVLNALAMKLGEQAKVDGCEFERRVVDGTRVAKEREFGLVFCKQHGFECPNLGNNAGRPDGGERHD